jgi:hypothetical protein
MLRIDALIARRRGYDRRVWLELAAWPSFCAVELVVVRRSL